MRLIYTIFVIMISFLQAFSHNAPHESMYHALDPDSVIHYSTEEIAYIKEKKELTMCTDPDWLPYEGFDKTGAYVGVAADYHRIIAHQTGLKYNILHTKSWTETIDLAKSGKCDILSIINKTPERNQFLDFSQPYIQSPSVFVTRENDKFINGIDDLRGQTLAIVKGYMVDEFVRAEHPEINRIYAENINEALKMVSKGKAFATVGSLLEMSYNMRHLGLSNLKITGDAKFGFSLCVGVKKGETTLLSVINKTLDGISKQDRNAILNRWISIQYQESIDYDMLAKVVTTFAVLLLIVGGKVYLTSNYNRKLLELNKELQAKELELQQINKDLEIKIAVETSKRLENERLLMQQSKLASMGDMIGAIAHQWRQPLNALGLIVQDIEEQHECGEATIASIKDNSNQAMHIIQQMSQTITDFSNFFKPDKSSECFKLCKNIHDVISMINPQMKSHGVMLSMKCMGNDLNGKINQEGDPFDCCKHFCVHGFPNEFKHVILNVLKNAMDALDSIKIENKRIEIGIEAKQNNIVIIEIHDNAGGISTEITNRIFEPYFSTKMEGKGVGIGLYMSKQILSNMGGEIWFENKDDGASFYIKMKLCDHS